MEAFEFGFACVVLMWLWANVFQPRVIHWTKIHFQINYTQHVFTLVNCAEIAFIGKVCLVENPRCTDWEGWKRLSEPLDITNRGLGYAFSMVSSVLHQDPRQVYSLRVLLPGETMVLLELPKIYHDELDGFSRRYVLEVEYSGFNQTIWKTIRLDLHGKNPRGTF